MVVYLLIGTLTAILGALPLGTTNVAVINTTIKENLHDALKIVYPAALAEVILVVIAINFNKTIENFIGMNLWVQYTIAFLVLGVGVVLLLGRKECIKDENGECVLIKNRLNISKPMLGFLLGLFNPTVLAYWIIVIALLNKKMVYLNIDTICALFFTFLLGVFMGKAITLYGYGRFSHLLKVRVKNITTRVNRIIGILLVIISMVQLVRIFY